MNETIVVVVVRSLSQVRSLESLIAISQIHERISHVVHTFFCDHFILIMTNHPRRKENRLLWGSERSELFRLGRRGGWTTDIPSRVVHCSTVRFASHSVLGCHACGIKLSSSCSAAASVLCDQIIIAGRLPSPAATVFLTPPRPPSLRHRVKLERRLRPPLCYFLHFRNHIDSPGLV